MFDDSLVTVWSAPNYCYRCGNLASILTVQDNGEREFKVYEAAEENERDKSAGKGRKFVSTHFSTAPRCADLRSLVGRDAVLCMIAVL